MTDQKDPPWYDYLGAAERAEVRRLVAEVERLQGHMRALADTSVDRDTAGIFKGMWQGSERECEQLRAEIERLNGVVDSWVDINNAAGVTLRAQEAEIDRLKADIRWWENQYGLGQAEIERLKALVKELADELDVLVEARYSGTKGYPSEQRRYERDIEPVKRARAALEDKP